MALQQVGITPHFIVRFDDSVGAPALNIAKAVLATCERDLARLAVAMPYTLGIGGDPFKLHPVDVQIVNDSTFGAGLNSGFQTGRESWMKINTFAQPGVPITDQFSRFVFVAEMAEQLMGFYGWGPGNSQGEALSIVMAQELYPDQPSSLVNTWLGWPRPRPDFISKLALNDRDVISFGCGMIFIYFLRYQLGFSYRDICGAGGSTLADRYRNLTHAADDPSIRVGTLLDKHFGTGNIQIVHDNPFPLLEGDARKILLGFGKQVGQPRLLRSSGTAHVSPFLGCPVKDYRYWEYGAAATQTCTATTLGLGLPRFNWRVNGMPLFFTSGMDLSVNVPVEKPDPNHPLQPVRVTETFHFDFQRTLAADGMSETLLLTARRFEGDYQLELEASAADNSAEPAVTVVLGITMHTATVVYEQAYYDDQKRCADAFAHAAPAKVRHGLDTYLRRLKDRPDPPPPGSLPGIVEAVDGIRAVVSALAAEDHALATKAASYAAIVAGLPPEIFQQVRSDTNSTVQKA